MKKIISFVLTLALLVSVLAILPLAAENGGENGYYVYLDQGITLVHSHGETEEPLSVAAKEIGDVKEFSCGCKNSVNSYVDGLLDVDKSTHTKALVYALLNYGAAAQNYFGYKTDALVGTPVENTAALKAVTPAEPVINDDAGIYMGASLLLEGTIRLRFYFMRTDISVKVDGKAEEVKTGKNYSYVDVPVMPYDMEKAVTVTVDGTDTSVSYAPINYLKNKMYDADLSEMVASIYAYGIAAEEYRESASVEPDGADRVLLVSIDGLRPDALGATEYFEMLKAMGAYTLSAQTINPSKTLPAHMSMFHSTTPTVHGITTNDYYSSSTRGNGITETLSEAGLTSAMFFDWKQLENLSQASGVKKKYVTPDQYYEASVKTLCDLAIDHIQNTPTDFTFLYFGHTDSVGERFGFTSSTYMAAVKHVFENLFNVLEALPDDYTVIITADHGGGGYDGNNKHGTTAPVDMLIPMIIIGDGFDAGASLGDDISILDVAPTVLDLLGVEAETYWVGHSLADRSESTTKDAALDLFLSEEAWDNYDYGTIADTTEGEDSITMQLSGSGITGLQLKKSAISEMISLGYRYLSFTVNYEKVSGGNTPTYADVYTYNYNKDYNFHVSDSYNESPKDPGECYYANGREIIIDLWVLYPRLTTEHGLIFVLSAGLYWQPTKGGYITFSDVDVTREIDTEEPTAEEKALDVFFNIGTWGQYSDHGKVSSINNNGSSLTVGVTKNSTNFAGMQLNKTAVGKMIGLGYRYLSFTMNYAAGSGKNPNYACVYYWKNSTVGQVKLDFLGYPNNDDHYYANGKTITIDLWGLYNILNDGDGLTFILTTKASWSDSTATKDGYFIFSNIEFS